MITGSLQLECNQRLTNLFNQSNGWLLNEAKKITKQREESECLVSELYEYLHLKCNHKIWWGDSYNLFYCNKFLHSRFMNKVKKLNKTILVEEMPDEEEDIPYNEELDLRLQTTHEEVMNELSKLKVTRQWPQAKIFELYWMSSDTLEEVSKKIGISKSTTFISVKKIRKYLENTLDNPFNNV
jgi:DNA-directed RNA polymerase specialized sigma24 family protein